MTREIIHIQNANLRCDACDYTERDQILAEHLIDKPCPKCGANMLTRQDYESAVAILNFSKVVNALLGPIFGTEKATGGMPVTIKAHGDELTIRKRT